MQGDQGQVAGTERGLKAALVFFDGFASIPFDGAEVEDFCAFGVADSARASAESVNQPGNFGEGRNLKDADAAGGALGPFGPGG